jgi:CRISPR-associated protein (TIGR02584 family)
MNKKTLIAVTGLTPQIITSTLYCLNRQKGVEIDELYVVTTSKGRDVVLGIDREYKYLPLKKQIRDMCEKFGFKVPRFTENKNIIVAEEESIEIPDMRSEEANKIFPNVLCRFVKEQASDIYNTLYCSISGGRKSMGVYLALAISLFGKENDKLVHVLTTPDNERQKLPYPLNKKQEKEFDLTEIPFVRLRTILNDFLRHETSIKLIREKKLKYSDIVELTQLRLSREKLYIDRKNGQIYYSDNPSVKLEPRELELYMEFINVKLQSVESVNIHTISTKYKSPENIRSKINKINNKILKAVNDNDKAAPYLIHPPRVYGTGNYGIPASADSFKIIE